jgi:hypothetical protein
MQNKQKNDFKIISHVLYNYQFYAVAHVIYELYFCAVVSRYFYQFIIIGDIMRLENRRTSEIMTAKDILVQMGLYSLPETVLTPEDKGEAFIEDFLDGGKRED